MYAVGINIHYIMKDPEINWEKCQDIVSEEN